MRKIVFPPIEQADENGLLAVGGDLKVDTLLTAYKRGIFPWPMSEEYPLTWFCPDPRGIIPFDNLHISKSMKRFIRHTPLTVEFNTHFDHIINQCANVKRSGQDDTWILPGMVEAYTDLFNAGHAFCVTIKNKDLIVGGLYGVCIGEFFAGESMYHTETNASKLALISLCQKLESRGVKFLDTQMVTPVTEQLGAVEISRSHYLHQLAKLRWKSRRDSFFI